MAYDAKHPLNERLARVNERLGKAGHGNVFYYDGETSNTPPRFVIFMADRKTDAGFPRFFTSYEDAEAAVDILEAACFMESERDAEENETDSCVARPRMDREELAEIELERIRRMKLSILAYAIEWSGRISRKGVTEYLRRIYPDATEREIAAAIDEDED